MAEHGQRENQQRQEAQRLLRAYNDQAYPEIAVPLRNYGFPREAFDWTRLPDVDTNFLSAEDVEAFVQALSAPDNPAAAAISGSVSPSVSSTRLASPMAHFTKRNSNVGLDQEGVDLEGLRRRGKTAVGKTDDTRGVAADAAVAAADVTALQALPPCHLQHTDGNREAGSFSSNGTFISAANDWAPVHEKVMSSGSRREKRRARSRRSRVGKDKLTRPVGQRSKDETREGYLYGLLKWPLLLFAGVWITGLTGWYVAVRTYVYVYEQFWTWRGKREKLRRELRATSRYEDWKKAAKELDDFLGNSRWREKDDFAYYDSRTVRRVHEQIRKCRLEATAMERERDDGRGQGVNGVDKTPVEDLKALLVACVKNNFVGVENSHLYNQTYYGTKNLVENFVDEVEMAVQYLLETTQLSLEEKRAMFKGMQANYGRTALCLSGGATFSYYHFGVIKALLEAELLPDIITGTSGGSLVAALVATRTNDELHKLLVPALAHKITACSEPLGVWVRRWWRTGARFDSVDWAKQCSWWTRGSTTFREAYERTGRVLNVSCVPAAPHSPTILCNYLTSPDCVIWSAVLASAAVPGIMNPVVLMMKTPGGRLVPFSFGHKWKDGSLRTDIPIKALNLHFNVNFTIVSQVNPHINLFFFSSRGSVGQPVTHRRGRGWRGGYAGSAAEQYLKLDLTKWLKWLRRLELLPRPLGQDWSQLWLQQFGGTVTIWPKSVASDFLYILSDPDEARLARMIHEGQQSAFPKLKFVANRLRVERLIEKGRREARFLGRRQDGKREADDDVSMLRETTGQGVSGLHDIHDLISDDDLKHFLRKEADAMGSGASATASGSEELTESEEATTGEDEEDEIAVDEGVAGLGIVASVE